MQERTGEGHRWRFHRIGGFDQVHLGSGADILALGQLDQKLWATLSCPTRGLALDSKTLALLDTDGDGRIRVPEVIAAAQWAGTMLRNPEELTKSAAALPLRAINDAIPEGKELLASARQILVNLGKEDATSISVDDTADLEQIFANTRFNGDGIIPAEAAENAAVAAVLKEIMDCLGAETDRSGAPGVSQEKVDQFFTEARAYADWWSQVENEAASILVLGDQTGAAVAAFEAVQVKVEDYFTRCRLAAFDARAAGPLNCSEEAYAALASRALSAATEELLALPIAQVEAGAALPLDVGLNPAWADRVAQLRTAVVLPLLGERPSVTPEEWATLAARLAPYRAWLTEKQGACIEKLGRERVREILASDSQAVINALLAEDKALEAEANAIASVDRLVRYHRDLYVLLNNFVSFRDFYSPNALAVFQAGTLYLDARSCNLCIRIEDIGQHSAIALRSGTYLAYCECARRGSNEKMTIAAAFTDGDSDNLMVGRNGIFYDRAGQDWDATIVKIIEHPISIRQAFWSPYKRFTRMIEEQIEKFASSRDKAMETQAGAGITGAAKAAETGSAPAAPFDVGKFAGIFAAIGLAIGAIGTAIAAVLTGLLSLLWWQIPLALLGLVLVISGPSMIMAWLKLRKRNLAPILDANGWAVNTLAKINIPFGTSLTQVAKLPKGAERSLVDPYAEKKRPWKLYLTLLIVLVALAVSWQKGYLETWSQRYWLQTPTPESEKPAPPAAEKAAPATKAPPAEGTTK